MAIMLDVFTRAIRGCNLSRLLDADLTLATLRRRRSVMRLFSKSLLTRTWRQLHALLIFRACQVCTANISARTAHKRRSHTTDTLPAHPRQKNTNPRSIMI